MTKGIAKREVVEHQEGVLTLYSDGTFERYTDNHVPSTHGTLESGVATRDVVIDPDTGVWARIFRPKSTFSSSGTEPEPPLEKVPIVLHFHGGGFCVGSPGAPHTHAFCRAMCLATRCLWVSVAYRLAPEHKLPAAYADGVSAFRWLTEEGGAEDPWVSSVGDVGRVFLAGESAGGTMVHYVAGEIGSGSGFGFGSGSGFGSGFGFGSGTGTGTGTRASTIAGLLLVHPAFPQERPAYDPASANLSNARVQFYHASALPTGARFGHPLMNPMHPESSISVSGLPDSVPVLVAAAQGDPLLAGATEYFETLRRSRDTGSGSLVTSSSDEFFVSKGAAGHCFHMFPENAPDEAAALRGALANFIFKHSYPN